jgi:hypothetical protein
MHLRPFMKPLCLLRWDIFKAAGSKITVFCDTTPPKRTLLPDPFILKLEEVGSSKTAIWGNQLARHSRGDEVEELYRGRGNSSKNMKVLCPLEIKVFSMQFFFILLKLASCCIHTMTIYNLYHQRNNTLFNTHYMFRPQMGHLQVLQVSHILLSNCNLKIPIFTNGSYKVVSTEFTNYTKLRLEFG